MHEMTNKKYLLTHVLQKRISIILNVGRCIHLLLIQKRERIVLKINIKP